MLSLGRVSALDPAMPSVGTPSFWTWCWMCASEALLFGGWALPIILGQARVCARRRRRRLLVFAALRFSLLPTPAGRPPDGLDRRRTRRHTPCYVSRRKLEPTYVLSFSV